MIMWLIIFLCAVILLLLLIILFLVAYHHEIAVSTARTVLRNIVKNDLR